MCGCKNKIRIAIEWYSGEFYIAKGSMYIKQKKQSAIERSTTEL